MAVKIIEGAKAINKATDTALKNASSLKELVQDICVSAALHHAKHGDETVIESAINRLCEGMVQVSHGNSVRVWFDTYGCLTWSAKEKCFKHDKKKVAEAKLDIEAYAEKLVNSKPYYDMTKAQAFQPVNVFGPMISQINRYYKMTDDEKKDPRNKVVGIDKAINFVKSMGMGDKLELPAEPLVQEAPVNAGRQAA